MVTDCSRLAGMLTISDPDPAESSFQAGTVVGAYGSLTIDTAGNWNYAADNTQAVIQQLNTGESISDVLTVTTADGTTPASPSRSTGQLPRLTRVTLILVRVLVSIRSNPIRNPILTCRQTRFRQSKRNFRLRMNFSSQIFLHRTHPL